MDARPTPEQRELEDAAARLVAKLGPSAVGDLDDAARRDRLEAALAQAGWRELRTGTPSDPAASGVEAALVTRALARGACDTAFVGPVLAHDLLRRAGLDADQPVTIAVSRDLAGLATAARGGLAIDAAGAAHALVLAGDAVLSAPIGDRVDGIDLTRAVADVAPAAGSAAPVEGLLAWEAFAVTLTAADLVGAMEGALTLSVDYAKERRQYGAAIGSYQAVQHLLAEARALAEGAYSAMVYAAWAVDALPAGDARQAAAVAKAYAARAARTVCETAIQVHGGIGNTWECMAHVFLRRSLLDSEWFGGDGVQLERIAAHRFGTRASRGPA